MRVALAFFFYALTTPKFPRIPLLGSRVNRGPPPLAQASSKSGVLDALTDALAGIPFSDSYGYSRAVRDRWEGREYAR